MLKLDTYENLQRWILENVEEATPENLEEKTLWTGSWLRATRLREANTLKDWASELLGGIPPTTPEVVTELLQTEYEFEEDDEATANLTEELKEFFGLE